MFSSHLVVKKALPNSISALQFAKRLGGAVGLNIERVAHTLDAQRLRALRSKNIDLVLDVGANTGQYGRALRANGYQGRIISYEPHRETFQELKDRTAKDHLWEVRNFALGNENRLQNLNVTESTVSSSLLTISAELEAEAPRTRIQSIDTVEVVRLDGQDLGRYKNAFVKIDTQGSELAVLQGGSSVISTFEFVETELSTTRLYTGQALHFEVIEMLHELGFCFSSYERGMVDAQSRVLQYDALFRRIDFETSRQA
jgi:FkbM family methyltransferase